MLVAEGLKLSFRDANGGAFRALDLPSFAPSAGAITAVRGPSGSGKSTLLYVLAGLLPPDHGAVRFGDVDIYGLSESRRDRWRREHIGFVFQDFHLLPELSPLANVAIAATFGGHGSNVAARSRQLLEKLGVPHSRRSVELLSRGERQRVAIARALLFDPPLILADEPTASLDDEAGVAVLDIFRGLARSGKTVVIATHDVKALVGRGDDPRPRAWPQHRAATRGGMNPLPVAFAMMRRHAVICGAFVFLIALAVGTGGAITAQERALRHGSARAADPFPLIVAAPGSQTDLLLKVVFLQPGSVELLEGEPLKRLMAEDRADFVAPIGFGDSFEGDPIVGTIPALIDHLAAGALQGRVFSNALEAVAGATSPLKIGDTFHAAHGHGPEGGKR